jgi:tyrosine-protein kinase Etk/Wzc
MIGKAMSEKKYITESGTDSLNNDNINYLIGTLVDHRKLIIGLTLLFAIVSVSYTLLSTPVYRADVLLQVEKNAGDDLVSSVSEILMQDQDDVQDDAEMALLSSRQVIGKTVSELKLDISVAEKEFPVFGKIYSKLIGDRKNISIERLEVPSYLQDKELVLEVTSNNDYKLTTASGDVITGKFGQLANKDGITLLVKNGNATAGTDFVVVKKSPITAINGVLSNLDFVSKSRDTGILRVRYQGVNPKMVVATLNSIAENYLQQNIKSRSEQAEKGLAFLSKQLPLKRSELDTAENELNQFRRENKSLDMSLEAQQLLSRGVALDTQLNQLTIQEVDISQAFTKEYPSYKALLDKKKTIEDERAKINYSIANLPDTQQQLIRLNRDVLVGQAVYVILLKKEQELKINKASIIGDVRIIDPAALKDKAVSPNGKVIIFISIYLAVILASILVLLKTIIYKRIDKIEELEQLGISVFATIPFSSSQNKIIRQSKKNKKKEFIQHATLSEVDPTDLAIEALRGLRTSLHFAMIEAKNNVLMISGVSPGVGKSFVSANLASLIATSGKKVLLLDADLRMGYIHEVFSASNDAGLSALLSKDDQDIDKYIQHNSSIGLDFIPRGHVPPNPSELLMKANFSSLISALSKRYDLIIIDTPPVLAVTDPSIVGRVAGTSMLVVGFGKDSVKEVETSISRFERAGVTINGLIVNGYVKKAIENYSEGSYYNYGYKY